MSVLNRKLRRDLWRIKTQVLAIALVTGCGIAIFVMAIGTLRSLETARDSYYDRQRFAELFASLERAPDSLKERITAIPGVERVETRVVADVTLDVAGFDEPATGRLVSLPENRRPLLNDLVLRQGRLIERGRPDEVVIGEAFADAHGLGPGARLAATINGRKRSLTVVGVALSPEFIYSIGPGVIIPDDRRFGVMWMGRDALAAAFDLEGAFNDVVISLRRGASAPAVIEKLDKLLERYGGVGGYDRSDQVSDEYLSGEMNQLRAIATVGPPIFLGVAAFLLNIVMSRLIETERDQIGLLKAFGYSNRAVGWLYLKFVGVIVGLGIVAGFGGGIYLGRLMTGLYTRFFRFPFLYYREDPAVFATAALITLAAAALATLGAVGRAVALAPAVAMLPPAPPLYRRSRLAIFRWVEHLSQPTRMILRHVGRWPRRSLLTVAGLSLAIAIQIATLFFYDSIERLIDVYFHYGQRQDALVSLVEPSPKRIVGEIRRLPGVILAEPYRAVPARLRFGPRAERVVIMGLPEGSELRRVLDTDLRPTAPPAHGLMLSTKLAELLAARPGDLITVEVLEAERPVRQVAVAGLVEEYIATPVYMRMDALNRLMREGQKVSGALLSVDDHQASALYRRLKDTPAVAAVNLQTAALRNFRKTMAETMNIMLSFYTAFGILIAIGVVYNSARIALSERGRELASMRVLGFTTGEVSYVLLGELGLLTVLALVPGCLVGYGLAWFFVLAFDTELFRVPLVILPGTYARACATVLAATAFSSLLVLRRITALDLVAVLKTRE